MLNKNRRFILLLTLIFTLALAACGGSNEEPAAPTESEPAASTESEAAPTTESASEDTTAAEANNDDTATEETAVDAEPVALTYWSMWNEDEPQGQVMKSAIADFEAANPNISVNVVWNGRDVRTLPSPR